MKYPALISVLLLLSSFSIAQKTKKITVKSDYPSYQETYYTLKSDETVKHGPYTKKWRKVVVKGQFNNGVKSGNWEYYDVNGDLAHKIDVTNQKLLFDKFAEEHLEFDTSVYSRPLIILGGYDALFHKIGNTLRYPAEARRNGTQGKVVMKIIISAEGTIKEIKVVEGLGDGLDEEAAKIMKLIDFEALPALDLEGKPTESEITLPINFRLG